MHRLLLLKGRRMDIADQAERLGFSGKQFVISGTSTGSGSDETIVV